MLRPLSENAEDLLETLPRRTGSLQSKHTVPRRVPNRPTATRATARIRAWRRCVDEAMLNAGAMRSVGAQTGVWPWGNDNASVDRIVAFLNRSNYSASRLPDFSKLRALTTGSTSDLTM